jgi:hypothetical protein
VSDSERRVAVSEFLRVADLKAMTPSELAVRLASVNEELGEAEDQALNLHAEVLRTRQRRITREIERRKREAQS